jgi:regulation of enolase protein 1 (concanavalin A-like superfamily)
MYSDQFKPVGRTKWKGLLALGVVLALSTMAAAADIAFYVGAPNVDGWYSVAGETADVETIISKVGGLFGDVQKFNDSQFADFGAWVDKRTNDGVMDIIWLNGCVPSVLYPFPNLQADGSRAELWLDGGNMIINVGDWFGYCSYEGGSRQSDNGATGAANILDLSSGIVVSQDSTSMKTTPTGLQYLPSIGASCISYRPIATTAVVAPWEVAAVFASTDGTVTANLTDPIVIHNTDTGAYVAFVNQAAGSGPPGWLADRGLTCAEFIGNWVAAVIGLGDRAVAGLVSPKDKATDVPRDTVLEWKPGQYAKTHDVYFGTVFDDVNTATAAAPLGVLASKGQEATTFDPAGVYAYGQTYYWRVDEVNAAPDSSVHKGKTWSFTAEPYGYPVKPVKATASSSMASTMGPDKTIDGSGLNPATDEHSVSASQMWLSKKGVSPIWIQYEFDAVYKLYQMWVWNSNQAVETVVGFGAKDVTIETSLDGTTWTALANVPEFAQATGEPNYVHNTTVDFGSVPAKFVKMTINANWADGTKQGGLAEVRFFYVPVKAFSPTPANGASGVLPDAVLNWRPGREAAQHQLYIGADAAAVTAGTVAAKTLTAHSFGLASLGLDYGRTYYWKVNEVNDAVTPKVQEGDLWSFTTIAYAVVDDFEAYDDACSRIFFSWVDGFGYSASADCGLAASAGNGTGSTVGNVNAPFAEKSVVHGGTSAMPMWFDNTKSPFYSEAQREWATPTAWTGGGVNTLVVYVRGNAPAFAETSPGTIIMNGTGTDIWNNGDQFRFVYKSLKGNGSIVAKVESIALTNEWAKAGVMIRESAAPGSAHAFNAATPTATHGISFQRRPTTDGASENTGGDAAGTPLPQWVKLTRNGNAFTAQYSADGQKWTDSASGPVTITMANDVLIGLAVTSHDAAFICGAKFSNVSTTGGVSGSWQVGEIGATQVAGNTPETFYVVVQDSAGKSKVVSNPDPTIIATGAWQEWQIPLSQFTSAGVNLGAVKKLTVGVGDRNAPKAGSSGKLYIDDIRLTRVATP